MSLLKKVPSPRLIQKYAVTRYQIDLSPTPIFLQVGEHNEAVDRLLRFNQVNRAAFLTAWNPESAPLSPEENAARAAELLGAVREAGYKTLTGRGIGPDPNWTPEESLLVLGMGELEATELARKFEQFAFLWHRLGQPTELLIVVGW